MASAIERERPSAVDHHDELLQWAPSQNITINGIKFVDIFGKGCGIIAQRNLKAGEILIFVPSSRIVTVDSDATFLTEYFELIREASVKGQLAAKYMLKLMDESSQFRPWVNMLPSIAEMRKNMPVLWSEDTQEHLPPSSETLLTKQKEQLNADLAALDEPFFSKLCTNSRYDKNYLVEMYKYSWVLVDTRTFYWDYEYPSFTAALTDKKKYEPPPLPAADVRERIYGRPREDCLAICPVVDCFNHSYSNENCQVNFSVNGFTATCSNDTDADVELLVSYGKYSNDVFLVEYGFMPDSNPNDFITLDKEILSHFSEEEEAILRENNLLGNYTLDGSGVCFRTQCALGFHLLSRSQWQQFIRRENDGVKEQESVNKQLVNILDKLGTECNGKIAQLSGLARSSVVNSGTSVPNGNIELMTIIGRWKQISNMITSCRNQLVI